MQNICRYVIIVGLHVYVYIFNFEVHVLGLQEDGI